MAFTYWCSMCLVSVPFFDPKHIIISSSKQFSLSVHVPSVCLHSCLHLWLQAHLQALVLQKTEAWDWNCWQLWDGMAIVGYRFDGMALVATPDAAQPLRAEGRAAHTWRAQARFAFGEHWQRQPAAVVWQLSQCLQQTALHQLRRLPVGQQPLQTALGECAADRERKLRPLHPL